MMGKENAMEKQYMTAKDVCEALGVSSTKAYAVVIILVLGSLSYSPNVAN